jgi:hypothetical protein
MLPTVVAKELNMSKNNPAVNDIVRVNDPSVGSKNGQRGRIVRIPNPERELGRDNRFKIQLDNGDTYVTRFAEELVFEEDPSTGGAQTIPAPRAVSKNAKVSEVIGNTIDDNKANAILAARVEAGKTVTTFVKDHIKTLLPAGVAEHADHPVVNLLLANLIAFSQKQFLPGNTKAAVVAACVMNSSMLEAGASLDIPNKINEIINGSLADLDFSKLGLPTKAAVKE